MSLNKRGEMTTKEILEILLGGAVVLLMLMLLYNLIAPNFNTGDETMKAYFDGFEKQIAVADLDKVGAFSIWLPADEGESREFYLVYFGDQSRATYGEKEFFSFGENVRQVCICSWEDSKDKCQYCKSLDLPVAGDYFSEMGYAPMVFGLGDKVRITKKVDRYEFRSV